MNAFVVAGGQSTRMGRDKALLLLDGTPLIAHAVNLLRGLGLSPRICGSRPDLARFAEVIADSFPLCGPLAGMEAALAVSDTELNLFLPVDLPALPAAFLRWLLARADASQAVATIPVVGNRLQPLCAAYSRRLLDGIRRSVTAGDYKVMDAVRAAAASLREPVDLFDVETVTATFDAGDWPSSPQVIDWFRNINTPADYERLAFYRSAGTGAKGGHPIS
ncbi:MAG: molybdenum cofactor guanylyltransferase [Acidobacteriaceae bacterium]